MIDPAREQLVERLLALGVTACVLGGAIGLDSNFHPFQNNLSLEGQDLVRWEPIAPYLLDYVLIKKKKKSFSNQV